MGQPTVSELLAKLEKELRGASPKKAAELTVRINRLLLG